MQPHEVQGILPKHIDQETRTFSVGDLEKLIKQATIDLELIDTQRKQEFKEHEMEKELERKKKLEV